MPTKNPYDSPGADDAMIARIAAFVRQHPPPNLPEDQGLTAEDFRKLGFTPRRLYPVVSPEDIAKAEAEIAFPIPSLLRRLYLEISNGIEGFIYNIFGLEGGSAGSSGTLLDEYRDLRGAFDYLGLKDEWKPGMLPFCDWGCTIRSCVDCTDPTAPVSTWEEGHLCPEGYTLHEFFEMWLNGSVRRSQDAEVVSRTIINPFTGKETTVFGRRKKRPKA